MPATSPPPPHSQPHRIGLVGVGRMGANIARRLHDTGFPITALYDLRRDAAAGLAAELDSTAVDTLAAVTDRSDTIITVVSDDAAMRAIYAPPAEFARSSSSAPSAALPPARHRDSLLQGARGKLFVNCATVSPSVHVDVERLVEAAGGLSLEACMASSIPQARDGTLYLMVAGRPAAYERAFPILRAMAKDLRHIGPAGEAAKVKALVNMVMNANTAALAEGLGLAAALGLDLTLIREVFAQTGAASRVLETDGADMQHRDHDCYFSAVHAAKDSGIALDLAHDAGLTLPLAEATKHQYDRLVAAGLGDLDKSAIAELTFPGRTFVPAAELEDILATAPLDAAFGRQVDAALDQRIDAP